MPPPASNEVRSARYRRRIGAWVAALSLLALGVGQVETPLDSDDEVLFLPTAGHFDAERREWVLPVRGWVYEREEDSVTRALLLSAFRRGLGLSREQAETEIFRRRARPFLVDNERGKSVTVRIAGREFALDPSGANGHCQATIRIAAGDLSDGTAAEGAAAVSLAALLPDGDERSFAGVVHLIPERGVSVISDIDDTIKVTEVRDRKAMLRRTFLAELEAVPGMAQVYARWHQQGVAFHYVSGGPWQLFHALDPFLRAEGFPAGSFHMRTFRAKDSSFFDLFADADRTKHAAIGPLVASYPHRQFILVGDSGERDPEIYGEVARQHAEQVAAIFIRDVTDEDRDVPRYRDAFRGYPAEQWHIFRSAEELLDYELPQTGP